VPHLCGFYPGICLTTEEKARKNLSQGSRSVTVYILPITKTPTHYKTTHTHTHTLQNNIKPPQYKLEQTHYKIHPNENTHNINNYPQYKVILMYIAPLSTRTSP